MVYWGQTDWAILLRKEQQTESASLSHPGREVLPRSDDHRGISSESHPAVVLGKRKDETCFHVDDVRTRSSTWSSGKPRYTSGAGVEGGTW
jgi:hypothetical protein